MLDQNTTTVLTTLITVFGTLGGVVLGVILSNRYIARQESAKRSTAVIEEVYTLLMNSDARIKDNIDQERPCKDSLRDNMNRIKTLICLYLPYLKGKFVKLDDSLNRLSIEVNGAQQANNPPDVWKNVAEPFNAYKENLGAIKAELEKLVR